MSDEWNETTGEFQNTPAGKVAWETRMRSQYPVGSRVRVVESDESEQVGLVGTVLDYDVGCDADTFPLIGVGFDSPPPGQAPRDGFYEEELAMLCTFTVSFTIETTDGAQGVEAVADAIDRALDHGTIQSAIVEALENEDSINMRFDSSVLVSGISRARAAKLGNEP